MQSISLQQERAVLIVEICWLKEWLPVCWVDRRQRIDLFALLDDIRAQRPFQIHVYLLTVNRQHSRPIQVFEFFEDLFFVDSITRLIGGRLTITRQQRLIFIGLVRP